MPLSAIYLELNLRSPQRQNDEHTHTHTQPTVQHWFDTEPTSVNSPTTLLILKTGFGYWRRGIWWGRGRVE